MKIDILPNYFLKKDGTFDKEKALNMCGKIAGVCYDKEGYAHLEDEPVDKTNRRINMTLDNGHHSVYDHININFNIQNVPKILAMVLNNEHQYTTSEKSARYTPVERNDASVITDEEIALYSKWVEIFKIKIARKYGNVFNDSKIQKLAQENARYLVTVFMPTQMIYSTSLRQINYLAAWMGEYIVNADVNNSFDQKLCLAMREFINQLIHLNVLEPRLLENEKHRSLSIFGKNLENKQEYFGDVYSTIYEGTFAQYAQAHRHRTLDYQLEMSSSPKFFVPPIISGDSVFEENWLEDMDRVKNIYPQGQLVMINEMGKYDDFILKCKERLCSAAQLEIMLQTKNTLNKYYQSLRTSNHPLADNMEPYTHGARCTFPDYECSSKCNFSEGVKLVRKI